MALSSSAYFYECHLTIKSSLAALIRDKDYETDLCRAISLFLHSTFNLGAVRRLSSHSRDCIVSSIVFVSEREMSSLLIQEVEALIKAFVRGWVEGLGAGLNDDLHDMWLNCVKIHFFSC